MEKTSVLQILTQLESDLKDIKSAKEQIDAVIKADHVITENIAGYSNELANVAVQMGALKTAVKNNLEGITSNLESDITQKLQNISDIIQHVETLSSGMESKVKQSSQNVGGSLEQFCSRVSSSFETKVDASVSSFETKVDASALSFEKKTRKVESDFSIETAKSISLLNDCIKRLKESSPDVSSAKAELLDKVQKVNTLVATLKTTTENVLSVCSSVSKDTTSMVGSLKTLGASVTAVDKKNQLLQDQLNEIDKKCKHLSSNSGVIKSATCRNQQLLYVAIILVVVDILLHFI